MPECVCRDAFGASGGALMGRKFRATETATLWLEIVDEATPAEKAKVSRADKAVETAREARRIVGRQLNDADRAIHDAQVARNRAIRDVARRLEAGE
jgi:hypothetical protein